MMILFKPNTDSLLDQPLVGDIHFTGNRCPNADQYLHGLWTAPSPTFHVFIQMLEETEVKRQLSKYIYKC